MEGPRIGSLNAVLTEIFETDLPDILEDYPHVQPSVTVISFRRHEVRDRSRLGPFGKDYLERHTG